ncbi:TetR/AcrR family transcriptional regulator [Pseudonocardia sp. CA-107938]|uniref:TetR/AcrR family transcriptional regulator n=1 Tax=Pseudonocardia sp. CA-107938 TaxID=3240021 RepID=UPI003D90C6FD
MTRAGIVDAAATLLREQGVHAVTTRAVAAAAGVQAPAIYRLFGDKDGLVDAVAEQVMAAYVAGKPPAEGDPVADLRTGWHAHVAFGVANPELFALLSEPGRAQRSPATAAGAEVLRGRIRRAAAAGRLRVDEERAFGMLHASGVGTVLAITGAPADARDPALADAMWDTVAAAVFTDAPASPADDLVALLTTVATVVPSLPALTAAERAMLGEWINRALHHLR